MVSMFPTPLITQYLLSFQSPWETTLRAAPLWFQVPTAVQQSSTCLLPSGWCPLVVSEGLKSCNTIQLYMYHKSSKIINIQHLLLQSIIILVQHGHFCFKTCLIYKFIISIFIANTLLFLLKMHNIRAIIFPDRNPHDFWRKKSMASLTFWRHPSWSVEFTSLMEGEFVISHVDPSGQVFIYLFSHAKEIKENFF